MVMLKTFTYIILSFTLYLFYITNSLVVDPYMDEIFHYPQAVAYFKGNYSHWDSKITTPPGLYFYTVVLLHPISWLSTLDVARVQCFRLVNLTFTIGILLTTYNIFAELLKVEKLQSKEKMRIMLLSSVNITLFPVLYFFNFLYYTDCGSTFFVLLMYYFHLKKMFRTASLFGAISLLFRQTNIVWIFFMAADESLCFLITSLYKEVRKKDKDIRAMTYTQFIRATIPIMKDNWKILLLNLIRLNIGYILVAIAFFIFIKINGSIALGDKEAHEVSFHIPQLFYFLLFFQFFASPYLVSISNLKSFLKFVTHNKMLIFELSIACAVCITLMSHVHPYLLADNRHFTFYIWKRLLGRNVFFTYALVPVYVYCGWSVMHAVRHKDYVFKIVALFCIFVGLVPQKLLEFRYFILPYIFLRLHLRVTSKWQPYLEFLLFSFINGVVLYLFFFKTFTWEDSKEIQRFMW